MTQPSIFDLEFVSKHKPPSLLSFGLLAKELESYGYEINLSYEGIQLILEGELKLDLGQFKTKPRTAKTPQEKLTYQKYKTRLLMWMVHIASSHRGYYA